MVELIETLHTAQSRGADEAALQAARQGQRAAQWRLDFVAAENSMGFHASQESARILGEAIDRARQAQIGLLRAMLGEPAAAPEAAEAQPAQ